MKKTVSIVVLFALLLGTAWAGLGSDKAMYVGGTLNQIKENSEGKVSATNPTVFTFTSKQGSVSIPFDHVNDLEYGQKAGRRLGLAIVVNPLLFFSKKRRHFLTVGYQDGDGKQQAAVFELGKDVVRVTLATLEARTGRKIEYEDEDARNSGRGN
ncbi:MAG TPA: hypothetical protein VFQ43_11190 [Nitrososphaera sp.]|nr:hypothetical protein [Nitrososphaera sp.]